MMFLVLLLASVPGSAMANTIKPPLLCAEVSSSNFNPDCLPTEIKTLSDIGDSEAPYIYLQWMFTETCGPYLAYFKKDFHTLPQVMAMAVTSVFVNWGVYIAGNFIGVAIMNIFEVAPRGRRCWGLFAAGSDTYKKVVRPLYYLLLLYSVVLMSALMIRFWGEVHKFRTETLDKKAAGGPWPVIGGLSYTVPKAPAACTDALDLMFPAYKDIFQILVLMVFTGTDCIFLAAQQCWTCILLCLVQCRCLCCYCCKGCCGIFGYMCCHSMALLFCLVIPLFVAAIYYFVGIFGAFLYYGIFALLISAVLIGVGYVIRYLLCLATCGFCRPLAIPFDEQKAVLFPFPPGQFFKKTRALGGSEEEKQRYEATRQLQAMGMQFDDETLEANSDPWERNLGVPSHTVTAGFPSFYAIVTVPQLIIFNLVFCSWVGKAEIVFGKSFADSNLDWFTAGNDPTAAWPFAMQIAKAMFVGTTNGLHMVFVDASTALFTDFSATIKGVWEGAVLGMDPMNLFSDNFSNFMAAILMGRLLVTVMFVCLRLTAVINRVDVEPEAGEGYSDEEELE